MHACMCVRNLRCYDEGQPCVLRLRKIRLPALSGLLSGFHHVRG